MKDELAALIQDTSRITHELADLIVLPTLTNADYEVVAKSLEALASGVRRIPTIKAMFEE